MGNQDRPVGPCILAALLIAVAIWAVMGLPPHEHHAKLTGHLVAMMVRFSSALPVTADPKTTALLVIDAVQRRGGEANVGKDLTAKRSRQSDIVPRRRDTHKIGP
jgi:hypothetical protein